MRYISYLFKFFATVSAYQIDYNHIKLIAVSIKEFFLKNPTLHRHFHFYSPGMHFHRMYIIRTRNASSRQRSGPNFSRKNGFSGAFRSSSSDATKPQAKNNCITPQRMRSRSPPERRPGKKLFISRDRSWAPITIRVDASWERLQR